MLVAHQDTTSLAAASQFGKNLADLGVNVVGAVLNQF
jgi:hypothetical protein